MTRFLPLATAALLTSLLAGCATPLAPKPAPVTAPPPPAAAPAPPPEAQEWRDLPLSPGDWAYAQDAAGSSARFGPAGAPALTIRCDRATHRIRLLVTGAGAGTMTVTTSYAGRDLPQAAGSGGQMEASLPAADPFLDRIAFSRGRVSYAVPGRPLLMVPAWAEPARVIEDCRG
ncbi:hypothetical protein [Sphingomonas sp.]|uniref:hypothetical protein n=1 Tax=Sphingomonas sp. TaxID=28214 RepID=UPI0025DDF5C6|nr:hypothetical protein [Sphingomonas sp.]